MLCFLLLNFPKFVIINSMKAVEIKNVKYSYDGKELALNDVTLSVEQGEFVAILGHNGSGKSTLAKLINGLLRTSFGDVYVFGMNTKDDKTIFDIRKRAGMVFQNPDNQMVASIVEDDIAFGLENIGVKREEIGERIDFALSAVGMEKFRNSTPTRLSGGQKQRIAIAGVLALKPDIMILDESTAMLDPKGRKEVLDVLLKLKKEQNMTIILITHFMEEALLADRAVVFNKGEIVMQGAPDEIFARYNELEIYNLALPKAGYVCNLLKQGGMPIRDCYTAETLAEEICRLLQKN